MRPRHDIKLSQIDFNNLSANELNFFETEYTGSYNDGEAVVIHMTSGGHPTNNRAVCLVETVIDATIANLPSGKGLVGVEIIIVERG